MVIGIKHMPILITRVMFAMVAVMLILSRHWQICCWGFAGGRLASGLARASARGPGAEAAGADCGYTLG
eukprot:15023900-Alexandrium_andersonii.AAC.1